MKHERMAAYSAQVQQLSSATGAQLVSPHFWEQVRAELLPALLSLAAAAEHEWQAQPGNRVSQQQGQQQLEVLERTDEVAVARALASRPCANLLCTNVRGCSEGRLRGRRCSGCGVVRYCSRECQVQHWHQHGPMCASLVAAEHL